MKTSVLLLTAIVTASCSPELAEPEEVLRPVRTVEASSRVPVRVREFSGTARASLESRLSFRVAGTIEEVAVEVGDVVEAQQLIARIDSTDFEIQLDQIKAAVQQARAEYRKASNDFDRSRTLFENNNISKESYDLARATKEASEESVNNVEKQLELAQRSLSYTELRAPTQGRIASVAVESNENISPGQEVVMLVAGSLPEVRLGIPENSIAGVVQGMGVQVSFDAVPNRTFGATVTEVGVAATGGSANYPVTVQLHAPHDQIRPGMAAQVVFQFTSGNGERVFVVPSACVREDAGGPHVYVADPSKPGQATIRRLPVQVGELTSDGMQIRSGLEEGQLVVTAGYTILREGMVVRLDPDWMERP